MRRYLAALVVTVALARLFGWAGECDRRTALEANAARAWSVAQWEARTLEQQP